MKVRTQKIDPAQILSELEIAATLSRFELEYYGDHTPAPLVVLVREVSVDAPKLYLSAGIHGDEPAGVLAILEALQQNLFPERLNCYIFPMLNPQGLAASKRENAMGIDLNRDYLRQQGYETKCHIAWLDICDVQYDLALHLHEDWEAVGSYIYAAGEGASLDRAQKILAAVEPFCGIDYSPEIDEWKAKDGVIKPPLEMKDREDWPETFHLLTKHTKQDYTIETPSEQNLSQRVQAQLAAIRAAITQVM